MPQRRRRAARHGAKPRSGRVEKGEYVRDTNTHTKTPRIIQAPASMTCPEALARVRRFSRTCDGSLFRNFCTRAS